MRVLLAIGLSLLTFTLHAAPEHEMGSCGNAELNLQWANALAKHPRDPVVAKMFNLRTGLCAMLNNGQIDPETARFTWEQALTNALLESARQERARDGLLQLFGTF